MRLNRKAGLLSRGALWTKHECRRTLHHGYLKDETDWKIYAEGGVPDGATMTGYTDYFVDFNGTFFYRGSGPEITITAPATGTLYRITDGTTIEKETWTYNSGVAGMAWYKTIRTIPMDHYTYDVGDEIGLVIAANGKYPGSNKECIYTATHNGYLIRGYQNGNYFAYKKVNEK